MPVFLIGVGMMKNEILKFLKQDYLNNLDLIYALEHGAKIKYYNQIMSFLSKNSSGKI